METEETEEGRRDEHLRQVILPRISFCQRFGVGRAGRVSIPPIHSRPRKRKIIWRFGVGQAWRVSNPTPFHSISFPALEKADDLEGLVELGIHVYMMVGFLNTCIVVMFDLIEKNLLCIFRGNVYK